MNIVDFILHIDKYLQYLQKKYELKVAELALEEAQDAKSQVRMQRDSEGNWGYVYTADESSVEDAEQTYEDKLFAMQEHTDNYLEEIQFMAVEAEQKLIEDLQNLRIEDFANEAEWQASRQQLIDDYYKKMGWCNEQLDLGIQHNKELYDDDWKKYSESTGYKIVEEQNWINDFQDTMLSTATGFQSFDNFQNASNAAIKEYLDDSTDDYHTYRDDVADALDYEDCYIYGMDQCPHPSGFHPE